MTKRKRFILFSLVLAAFVTTAPVIIFYVQGYRFNFQNFDFSRTGAIYLKTTPKKAQVLINHDFLKKETPVLIEGLLPRNYNISIQKNGYYSWEKQIAVQEGLVSEAKNIILIPQNPKEKILSSDFNKVYFSPDKNYFFVVNQNSIALLNDKASYTINLESYFQTPRLKERLFEAINEGKISWNNDGTKIILRYRENNYAIDFLKQEILQFFINGADLEKTRAGGIIVSERIDWHPIASNSIILFDGDNLYSYDLQNKTAEKLIENLLYYKIIRSTFTSYVYYMDKTGFLYQHNLITKTNEKISSVPFAYNPNIALLVSGDKKKIAVFYPSDQKLFLLLENNIKIFEGINFVSFSVDSSKIVYGNQSKIWVLFLETDSGHPRKQKGVIEEIVSTDNQNITGVFWHAPTSQHLWILADELYFTELDNRPPRNTYTVLKNTSQNIFINGAKLYYIKDDALYLMDITE